MLHLVYYYRKKQKIIYFKKKTHKYTKQSATIFLYYVDRIYQHLIYNIM